MEPLENWIGRYEDAEDVCALPIVRRLAALLDKNPAAFRHGSEIPQGWHVCLFTSTAMQSELGRDGHPRVDKLMPPAPLPRRVLGGRRVAYHGPIIIGDGYKRRNEIVSVVRKRGKSGEFVLITTRSSIRREATDDLVVVEEQDSIYMPEKTERENSVPEQIVPFASPAFTRDIRFEPSMLFRYSAVTFNTHRIHYDLPYATQTENYPGLMVNGGFTALLLLDLFSGNVGKKIVKSSIRNRAAIICGGAFRLCGASQDDGWIMWAEDAQTSRIMLECKIND